LNSDELSQGVRAAISPFFDKDAYPHLSREELSEFPQALSIFKTVLRHCIINGEKDLTAMLTETVSSLEEYLRDNPTTSEVPVANQATSDNALTRQFQILRALRGDSQHYSDLN
jgi:hypothetical protein